MRASVLIIALMFVANAAVKSDDFKTLDGKKYKNVIVSRTEPDGIIITSDSGIIKLYFSELPQEVRAKYGYDPERARAFAAANARNQRLLYEQTQRNRAAIAEQQAAAARAEQQNNPPTTQKDAQRDGAKSNPTPWPLDEMIPQANNDDTAMRNDSTFSDLQRRDWYEDLKEQEKINNRATFTLELLREDGKNDSEYFGECTPTFFKMLARERAASRTNNKALAEIAGRIISTKNYETYKRLKAVEDVILAAIATEKLQAQNEVAELQTHVSERDAALLEIWQQHH